ncbi:hydrolase, alpha/beta fold family, putative [Synechococcus sp. PCC 7335]|uniref:YheT family hydrolase n=1 Tax=Synechococcus sp. (strain ATCC 29403 / PCC 7335) TaxID=91464 RepID=UPI00017ED53F|nr:alpha/beta fold hydrolase [Synechococcus sp. PCC 7335]EDX84289.1 hydrolase, alpha/beta fold family, putative [Synechococcus sp. PCC 7335]
MLPIPYQAPWPLNNGLLMTLYVGLRASKNWEKTLTQPEPTYHEKIFTGAQAVPIFGLVAIPPHPIGTVVGTYGITGDLEDQWFLRLMARKAYARGYAVVIFDWRAHGKTAKLSPALTSDGLYEGEDFVRIAAAAKHMGAPAPFWFTGFSLGGLLALWGIKAAQELSAWGADLGIDSEEIAGGAVISPALESLRSLTYLAQAPLGKYLEKAITRKLKQLLNQLQADHPTAFDSAAVDRVNSIWSFDQEIVIPRLGFKSVADYYLATSGLYILPALTKPTFILYAADDPLFDPTLVPDIESACANNPAIDLSTSEHGGHVGFISSSMCQQKYRDIDQWWAWNRILEWFGASTP